MKAINKKSHPKNLIILRGIPGSGKSSFANLLGTKAICSADDYHIRNGVYDWQRKNIGRAHIWCQRKCERHMMMNAERIVIANTNTAEHELQPYMDLAKLHGYMVHSIIVENRHGSKNIHNVPDATLENMRNRFNIKL